MRTKFASELSNTDGMDGVEEISFSPQETFSQGRYYTAANLSVQEKPIACLGLLKNLNNKNENSDWINHLLDFKDCAGHLGDINVIDVYGSPFIYEESTCWGKAKVLRIENWFTLESQNSNLSFLC